MNIYVKGGQLSWLERHVDIVEVTSSNLVSPTLIMSEIQITLPDDTIKEVEQGSTSGDIARSIGKGLFRNSIAAKVNGNIVDLESPIEKNTNVEILLDLNRYYDIFEPDDPDAVEIDPVIE